MALSREFFCFLICRDLFFSLRPNRPAQSPVASGARRLSLGVWWARGAQSRLEELCTAEVPDRLTLYLPWGRCSLGRWRILVDVLAV